MSISEAIHHYNVGTLITIPTSRLYMARVVLENKIDYMTKVLENQEVSPEVLDDLRKYKDVLEEVTRLYKDR